MNSNCQVNVNGFRKVKEHSSGRYSLYVDESTRQARVQLHFTGESVTSGTGQYEVDSFVPTEYCPPKNLNHPVDRWNHVNFYMWSGGTVGVLNNTGSTMTLTIDVQVDYTF